MILYGCECPFNLPMIICNLILYYFCSNDLPEADKHDITEEYNWIRTTLSASHSKLPHIQAADEQQHPSDGALTNMDNRDYSMLVSLRTAPQTHQAAHGFHTEIVASPQEEPSMRVHLICEFHAVLRGQQEKGVGTGLERKECWKNNQEDPNHMPPLTGNSANAMQVAKKTASEVSELASYHMASAP